MWMGESFTLQISYEDDSVDTMEYKGEQYLRELMQRCMVQVPGNGLKGMVSSGKVNHYNLNIRPY